MTNRETDGDIHGERAAEIHRLVGELRTQFENFERAWQMRGDGIDHLQSQLDACRPYLKEGETVAECLSRNRMDIARLMGFLATEKTARDTLQEDAARYRWMRMNRLWLKANLPMLHVGEFDAAIDKARDAQEGE